MLGQYFPVCVLRVLCPAAIIEILDHTNIEVQIETNHLNLYPFPSIDEAQPSQYHLATILKKKEIKGIEI